MVLPAIAIAGCAAWMLLPWPSDAESQSGAAPTAVFRLAQDASGANDAVKPTNATLASPAPSRRHGQPVRRGARKSLLRKPPRRRSRRSMA